jgi:hypothetical protein
VKKYECTECGAEDSDREVYGTAPLVLVCWNCRAGARMTIPEQAARREGMVQVNSNEE